MKQSIQIHQNKQEEKKWHVWSTNNDPQNSALKKNVEWAILQTTEIYSGLHDLLCNDWILKYSYWVIVVLISWLMLYYSYSCMDAATISNKSLKKIPIKG